MPKLNLDSHIQKELNYSFDDIKQSKHNKGFQTKRGEVVSFKYRFVLCVREVPTFCVIKTPIMCTDYLARLANKIVFIVRPTIGSCNQANS